MTWKGTLEFADFGPGAWVLKTDDGKKVTLYGDIPEALKGQRVVVEGKKAGGMGFAMVGGDSVEVSQVRAE